MSAGLGGLEGSCRMGIQVDMVDAFGGGEKQFFGVTSPAVMQSGRISP